MDVVDAEGNSMPGIVVVDKMPDVVAVEKPVVAVGKLDVVTVEKPGVVAVEKSGVVAVEKPGVALENVVVAPDRERGIAVKKQKCQGEMGYRMVKAESKET